MVLLSISLMVSLALVHVSEFAQERVNDPNEYVATGDMIKVKVTEVDKMGRIKLSAKEVESLSKK